MFLQDLMMAIETANKLTRTDCLWESVFTDVLFFRERHYQRNQDLDFGQWAI